MELAHWEAIFHRKPVCSGVAEPRISHVTFIRGMDRDTSKDVLYEQGYRMYHLQQEQVWDYIKEVGQMLTVLMWF